MNANIFVIVFIIYYRTVVLPATAHMKMHTIKKDAEIIVMC
jgi:hypothetical protein